MNQREVVNNLLEKERYDFTDLLSIMKLLRAEGGCPWDREQTHGSIRACMIEEAYEVVEAIDTETLTFCERSWETCFFRSFFTQSSSVSATPFRSVTSCTISV